MKKDTKPAAAAPSARFDFNKAARKAMNDHPALKGKTLFIDAANDDFAAIEQRLLEMNADEDDISYIHKTVRDAKRLKTSFHQELDIGKKGPLNVMVFHADKFPIFGQARGERDDTGTFDHETGHALAHDAEGALSENTADAYAAIRHLQRFGGETADLDYAGWKRAAVFMLRGVTTHLTTLTIDKIICDAKTADFVSLSPAETIAIAQAYAKQHTPPDGRLKKLKAAFSGMKKLEPAAAFKKLAAITFRAKEDSDTFYLGARVLQGALQEGGIDLDGRHLSLEGGEWDGVREKLAAKIAGLPAKHRLRQR